MLHFPVTFDIQDFSNCLHPSKTLNPLPQACLGIFGGLVDSLAQVCWLGVVFLPPHIKRAPHRHEVGGDTDKLLQVDQTMQTVQRRIKEARDRKFVWCWELTF